MQKVMGGRKSITLALAKRHRQSATLRISCLSICDFRQKPRRGGWPEPKGMKGQGFGAHLILVGGALTQ